MFDQLPHSKLFQDGAWLEKAENTLTWNWSRMFDALAPWAIGGARRNSPVTHQSLK